MHSSSFPQLHLSKILHQFQATLFDQCQIYGGGTSRFPPLGVCSLLAFPICNPWNVCVCARFQLTLSFRVLDPHVCAPLFVLIVAFLCSCTLSQSSCSRSNLHCHLRPLGSCLVAFASRNCTLGFW